MTRPAASLIASFVGYGRDSGAAVCAEGIETIGDLVRLADLDVAFGQGYVIARPGERLGRGAPDAVDACTVSFTAALAAAAGGRSRAGRRRSSPAPATATIVAAARHRSRASCVPTVSCCRPLRSPSTPPRSSRCSRGDPPAAARRRRRGSPPSGHRSLLRVPVTCEGVVVGRARGLPRERAPVEPLRDPLRAHDRVPARRHDGAAHACALNVLARSRSSSSVRRSADFRSRALCRDVTNPRSSEALDKHSRTCE